MVYNDHSTLKYLLNKKDSKPKLIRLVLLSHKFDIEIKDKKGSENVALDNLSRLETNESSNIREELIKELVPNKMLLAIGFVDAPWFVDIADLISCGKLPADYTYQ